MGRQVIDIRKDGEKVYVKNHAKVTFLSDGTNVEQRIIDVSNDLSTKVNKDYIDGILENIIVDSSQIDFNQLQNNPFIDNNSGELEVMDESGNIIAKIDAEGIHSVDFIAGEHRLSDKTDKTYVDEAIKNVKVDLTGYATEEYVNNIDFYNIKDNPIVNNGDGKLLFVDENGYIGLQLEEDGLYIKDVIADGHTLSQKANKSDLPTKLSDLDNDTNYITLADIPPVNIPSLDEYITEEELNSKGYITQHQDISHLATKAEVSDIDFYNIKNNPVINSETGKLLFVDESGNIGLQLENNGLYVSNVFAGPHVLSNKADKSEVPTSTSQLTNDSGYITKPVVDQAIASLVDSAPETLDTIGEIASALKNNAGIVDVLNQSISNKQNTIEDLDAIRAGATKGASALQEIPEEYAKKEDIPSLDGYATQAWVNNKNYATEEDLSSIEFNSLQNNPLVEDSNGEFNLVDDLGNVGFKVNEEGLFVKDVIAGNHVLSNKQDTLVSGTNVKTINGTSILGSGDITISGGNSDANIQAVDTGDVIDDVNVDYATKTYVDGLVGDINSVLESIINGGNTPALIDNYLSYISRMIEDTSSYYFLLDYPAESDLVIQATYSKPNVVNGSFQGYVDVTEEYHIDKGNMNINEVISEFREFTNVSIIPEYDNVYRYIYNA